MGERRRSSDDLLWHSAHPLRSRHRPGDTPRPLAPRHAPRPEMSSASTPFLVPNRFCYGLNSPSRARETRVLPRSSATRLHSSDALVILPLPNTANRPLSAPRRLSWPRAAPFWKGYKSLILSTMCISHKHIFVQLSGPDRKIDLEVDDDLCRPHRMLKWVGFGERRLGVGIVLRRWFWYDHIVMETRYC